MRSASARLWSAAIRKWRWVVSAMCLQQFHFPSRLVCLRRLEPRLLIHDPLEEPLAAGIRHGAPGRPLHLGPEQAVEEAGDGPAHLRPLLGRLHLGGGGGGCGGLLRVGGEEGLDDGVRERVAVLSIEALPRLRPVHVGDGLSIEDLKKITVSIIERGMGRGR